MRFVTLIIIICVLFAEISPAATIHVPADQPTIQAGIDAALAGDTVMVTCGPYIEWDIILKNGVCLISETGQPECDSIDCHMGSRIFIADGVDSTTIIEGFVIAHGSMDSAGAAMICQSSSPTIKNCRFRESWSTNFGGAAIYIKNNSFPRLINCDFIDNWASSFSTAKNPDGAAIMCDSNSSAIFDNCTFTRNMAEDDGGAVFATNYSNLTFEGCTFIGNRAEADSAGGAFSGGGAVYLYAN
jgi:predicted outer membrane repeat protein